MTRVELRLYKIDVCTCFMFFSPMRMRLGAVRAQSAVTQKDAQSAPSWKPRRMRPTLDRRCFLADVLGSAALVSIGGPTSAAAPPSAERLQRFGSAVRAPATPDIPISSWGESWSATCSWSPKLAPIESQAPLPAWLAGRWRVTSKLDSVDFPIGRKFITESMPGVRMVSILPLPNIGNTPNFELEYASGASGSVVPSRGANVAATLEAFWPDAKVVDIETPSIGRVLLRYESPTRTRGKLAQSVDVRLCSSEGGPLVPAASPADGEWVTSEVWQQDNLEQGTRGEYLVLSSFRREQPAADGDRPTVVRCRQRIAAFLQPTDGAYFEALGKPAALYDYSFVLTRMA